MARLRLALCCSLLLLVNLAPVRAKDPDPKADAAKIIARFLSAPDEPARKKIIEEAASFPAMPYKDFKSIEDEFVKLSQRLRKANAGKRKLTVEGKTFEFEIASGGKPGTPSPLMIYLHGSGGPDGLCSFWSHAGFVQVCPVAPVTKADGEHEWTNGFTDAFIFEMLRTLRQEYNIDTNRVYLAGFSAGGFGTWYYALRYPDLFAAAFPMAGGPWIPDLGPEYPTDSNLMNLKYLPISIWHGALDKNVAVVPERKAVATLQKLGYKDVFYKEYPNGDHNDWFNSDAGNIKKEVTPWIETKVRDPFPKKVVFFSQLVISKVNLPITNGAYWIWCVTPPVDSEIYKSSWWQEKITGTISEGNKVVVTTTQGIQEGYVYLRKELIDLDQPVEVVWNNKSVYKAVPECRLATLLETFGRAWDRELTYPVRIDFKKPAKK